MPSWALIVTLGPVGGFIASGRRSRDLWWGSTWLSECACSVAAFLSEVPSGDGLEARPLVPSAVRVKEVFGRREADANAYGGRVTNHVEAEVSASSPEAVAELAVRCEERARGYLADQLRRCLARLDGATSGRRARVRKALDAVVERHLYEEQVRAVEAGDFIEVFSAWAPVEEGRLSRALNRAWTLLDARKRARYFDPASWTREGRAKCDLDPGRDSVLRTANTRDRRVGGPEAARRHLARRLLGIGPQEELDTLGLARRLAVFVPGPDLQPLPFPPISRVAADPWLHRVAADPATAADLRWIRGFLESREVQDNPLFFAWCSPARDPEAPWDPVARRRGEGLFPFDAALLFENGLDALIEELKRTEKRMGRASSDEDLQKARRQLETLRPWVRSLHRRHGPPEPYYALLMMDGDGVGQALLEEDDLDRKQHLVAALDRFADGVEEVVRGHHGCAFYVGGDDLAAYLPLDRVVDAVLALDARFGEVREAFPPASEISISAGIALAHAKADLRAVRTCAHRALANAKRERRRRAAGRDGEPPRGWATVVDLPRSGGERTATGPLTELLEGLRTWSELLAAEKLSLRSAGFLEDLADRLSDGAPAPLGGRRGIELVPYRILAQARRSEKKASPRLEVRLLLIEQEGWQLARELAAELAIASRLRKAGACAGTVEEGAA